MLTSVEVRWFLAGSVPEKIEAWFLAETQIGQLSPKEQRQDIYLDLSNREDLGIKLRQNNLEVKWRETQFGSRIWENLGEGYSERWMKWSCPDKIVPEFAQQAIASSRWIAIDKIRYQRHHQQAEGKCALELSQLQLKQQTWWSFAAEATGDRSSLETLLDRTLKQLCQRDRPCPQFELAASYSYPHFLSELEIELAPGIQI
ncbi:hypothetical protein QQ054_15410 [Oscillatoria amoena NRMC-F 0135]|nr:hypothetical protein [Geitlerinema splendidum]MDL5047405.1 hypothetical protein [Oscillatoria amoena NRMC-F 0135]